MPKAWKGWSSSSKQSKVAQPSDPSTDRSHNWRNRTTDPTTYPNAADFKGQQHLPLSRQIDHGKRERSAGMIVNNENHNRIINEQSFAVNGSQQYEHESSNRNLNSVAFGHSGQGLWCWIPHVQQSADDVTVANKVKDVLVLAEGFVNNFYWDRPCNGNISDDILDRTNCSSIPTNELHERLTHVDHQIPLIKHVLVTRLLDLISFYSPRSKESLLPGEFQNYRILAEASVASTSKDDENPHIQPALSAYRVLSAYIRPNVQKDQRFLQKQTHLITSIMNTFEDAFRYWVKQERKLEERQVILKRLIEMTRDLGIFLFSQPSVYLFHWDVEPRNLSKGEIPVWPALLKVFDNNGKKKVFSDTLIAMKCDTIFDQANEEHARQTEPKFEHLDRIQRTSGATESSRRVAMNSYGHRRKEIPPASVPRDPTQKLQGMMQDNDQVHENPLLIDNSRIALENQNSQEEKYKRQPNDGGRLVVESQKSYTSEAGKQHLDSTTPSIVTPNAQISNLANWSATSTQYLTVQRPELREPQSKLIHTQVTQVPFRNDRHHGQVSIESQGRSLPATKSQGSNDVTAEGSIEDSGRTLSDTQYSPRFVASTPMDRSRLSTVTDRLPSPQEVEAVKAGGVQIHRTNYKHRSDTRSSPIQTTWPPQNNHSPEQISPQRHNPQPSSPPQNNTIWLPPSYNSDQTPYRSTSPNPWDLIPSRNPPPQYQSQRQDQNHPELQPTDSRRCRSASPPKKEVSHQRRQSRRPYRPPPNATPIMRLMAEDNDIDGRRSRHRDRDRESDREKDRDVTSPPDYTQTEGNVQVASPRKKKKRSSSTSSVRSFLSFLDGK